ncbi:MAG TPA: hypothetical protein VFE47_11740 [Tepidisphaeraceae bacterium]|nr:hypothetical protein [Tepidisphaeraceae bacterium]
MTPNTLSDRLRELKRRWLAINLASGTAWSIAAAVALVLLCMWLDLATELPPLPRILSTLACIAVGLVIAVRLGYLAWRGASPSAMARRLDNAGGAFGQILSGVDLLLHPMPATASSQSAALTAGLSSMAVNRAAQLAANISAPSVIPRKPIFGPLAALGFIAITIAILSLMFPRLAKTQWARFTDPFGDHPPYSRIQLSVDPGDARVIYGGNLDIRATASGETVDSVNLIIQQPGGEEEKLPMFPEPGGAWRGTLTAVTSPARYYIRAGRARSRRYEISIITVPKLEQVRMRITPPAYTHRPALEGAFPPAGLSALPGTLVQIWAKSNRPLSGGTIASDSDQATPGQNGPTTQPALARQFAMKPAGDGAMEVQGSFVVHSTGVLHVNVTDVEGQPSVDSFAAPVTLLRDEKPFVRIMEPKPESFATPDVTLNIELLAEDDYGISKLELYRGLNESRFRPTSVAVPPSQPTLLPATVALPLADYGVSPGDTIKLFARVEDNDPAGAKGSESPVTTVHIISKEQMQQMMLAREGLETFLSKYEQATRRMEAAKAAIEKLQKELAKADPNSELAKELREKIKQAADQIKHDADELSKMAAQDLPFDLDQKLRQQLDDAAKAMEKAADDLQKIAAKPGISAGEAEKELQDAKNGLGGQQQQFQQKADAPLEHLAKIYPLIEDQAVFIDLYQRQRDLAQRMEVLEGHDNEDDPAQKARMRDLEAEQRQIRTDLRQLLDKIDNDVAELPADNRLDDLRKSAGEFAKAVRESTAGDEMAAAESGLSEFIGTKAATSSRAAADTLEKFIAKAQGVAGDGEGCLKFQPELADGLGNTVEQLLQAAGLGLKPGQGSGNGGGFSARRSSLSNVGLYGRIPTRGGPARAGGGHSDHGVTTTAGGTATPGDPTASNAQGKINASGQSQAAVPDRYKRRVGEYFQRVSDELDQQYEPPR